MYDLRTDEELRIDRSNLEEALDELDKDIRDAEEALRDGYKKWHTIENPREKRNFHLRLLKASDHVWAMKQRADAVEREINYINNRLLSHPSETIGCIYDTPHELDLNELNDFDIIIGVKLC